MTASQSTLASKIKSVKARETSSKSMRGAYFFKIHIRFICFQKLASACGAKRAISHGPRFARTVKLASIGGKAGADEVVSHHLEAKSKPSKSPNTCKKLENWGKSCFSFDLKYRSPVSKKTFKGGGAKKKSKIIQNHDFLDFR
ncbi:hypothetical protein [Pseudomonas sp. CJQ_13]|uniref:hypothetical protein n=1 Tax=Pseudomonas sp. CJQ_13 TaxID=3367170 RepID=UPI00370CBB9C